MDEPLIADDIGRSLFDNDKTYLYKLVNTKGTPVTMIIPSLRISVFEYFLTHTLDPDDPNLNELNPVNVALGYLLNILLKQNIVWNMADIDIDTLPEIDIVKNYINQKKILKDINLKVQFDDWYNRYLRELVHDGDIGVKINYAQNAILDVKNFYYSDFQSTETIITGNIIYTNGKYVTVKDCMEFFNGINVNMYLPYVKIKSGENDYFKVYTGTDITLNYDLITPARLDIAPNAMVCQLFIEDNFNSVNKNSYTTVNIFFEDDHSVISFTLEDYDDDLITRLSSALNIEIINITHPTIKGSFDIYDVNINETILANIILNNPVFNNYVSVVESALPLSLRKRFSMAFRTLGEPLESQEPIDVSKEIIEEELEEEPGEELGEEELGEDFTNYGVRTVKRHRIRNRYDLSLMYINISSGISDGKVHIVNTNEGKKEINFGDGQYVKLKVIKSQHHENIPQCMDILARLFGLYKIYEEDYKNLLSKFNTIGKKN